jgi:hypothetical protein
MTRRELLTITVLAWTGARTRVSAYWSRYNAYGNLPHLSDGSPAAMLIHHECMHLFGWPAHVGEADPYFIVLRRDAK